MWKAVANSIKLWGWTLWDLLPVSVGERLMPGHNKEHWFCSDLICTAAAWKLETWRILPAGCELPDDVCRSHLERFAAERKERAREVAESPFEIPPVPEERRAEVTEYERRSRKHAIENVDEDIAAEEARIEALRHFDRKAWKLLTTRLWYMSAHDSLADQFLFRPGKRGQGRTIDLNISGTEYVLHLDFSDDAVGCRLEFIKEIPPTGSFELKRWRERVR